MVTLRGRGAGRAPVLWVKGPPACAKAVFHAFREAALSWMGDRSEFADRHLHVWEMDAEGVFQDTTRDDDASSAAQTEVGSDAEEAAALPASPSHSGDAAVPSPPSRRHQPGAAVPPGAPKKKAARASSKERQRHSPEVVRRVEELKTREESHPLYQVLVEVKQRLRVLLPVLVFEHVFVHVLVYICRHACVHIHVCVVYMSMCVPYMQVDVCIWYSI